LVSYLPAAYEEAKAKIGRTIAGVEGRYRRMHELVQSRGLR